MLPEESFAADRGQRTGARMDPRLNWWREARFGLFIHWGLYAIPAGSWKGKEIPGIGEWIQQRARIPVEEYEKLAEVFNPLKFNAAEWVSLAKRAGQKYLVITSKHHDGFCLFKSAHTPYNIADGTPFRRDVIGELAQECARQGMRFGLYYSQTQDWHHPDGAMAQHPEESREEWEAREAKKDFGGYIENYVKPQVRELLTHYGPIGLIWFDTPMYIRQEQSRGLLDLVHQLQPDCLVCGRVGNAQGDYASARDNRIPQQMVDLDWETPATINDTWGYKSNDHKWKSTKELLHKLVDITSKGGNYLLNIGPTAEGEIPLPSVERLEAMGAWLTVNGWAVDLWHTSRAAARIELVPHNNEVRQNIFTRPGLAAGGGGQTAPGLPSKISKAYLLADTGHAALRVDQQGEDTLIYGPTHAPNSMDSVIVLGLA